MNWYIEAMKKYAVFSGRSRRKEYWLFFLVNIVIMIILGIIDKVLGSEMLGLLYSLALVIPGIAVSVRRLHDTSRTGWWLLIGFIPIIGTIILIVFYVQDGVPGENEYGSNPKGVTA